MIVLIIYFSLDKLLEQLYNFLLGFGIQSRSINLLLRDEIQLSGRENIYQQVINKIVENPMLGIGIGGIE